MVCKPCFEETEESIKAKTKPVLVQPTAGEIEQHEVAHVPFRSWCKFCIMGKGVASAHHIGESVESQVPIISVDYAFMGSKKEKEEEKGSPIMVIKDKKTKRILSRMIPQKGVSKYAIKKLKIDIDQMGYKKIILKK